MPVSAILITSASRHVCWLCWLVGWLVRELVRLLTYGCTGWQADGGRSGVAGAWRTFAPYERLL